MGALWNGRCYASQSDAADGYFTSAPPVQTVGVTSYVNYFSEVNGVWRLVSYSVNQWGSWSLRFSTVAQVPTFPTCDPAESFFDGMTVGWGVVAAMAIAWGVRHIRRQAR